MPLFKPTSFAEVPKPEVPADQGAAGTAAGEGKPIETSDDKKIFAHNIVTVNVESERDIQSYEPSRLRDNRGVKYSKAVGHAPVTYQAKNTRFKVSELTRGPLSIAKEEEERIEKEVELKLAQRMADIRQSVLKESYEEGFNAGKNEAKEEFLKQNLPVLQQIKDFAQALDNAKGEIFKANEEYLLRLINQVVRLIALREVKEDKTYTKRLVLELIERIGIRENLKIFVGAEEFKAVDNLKQGIGEALGQLKNITIELDPEIKGQGCRIESEFGEIDASIDIQLQNIANALGIESKT